MYSTVCVVQCTLHNAFEMFEEKWKIANGWQCILVQMDCESGTQWKRIICFLLLKKKIIKKKRNFEGQELLIGLPLKGISFFGCYSSPFFLFLVKYQREFSSSGGGSCQEIVGGQGVQLYGSMIGDNSLDYVGKTKKKKKPWRW